MPRSDLASGIDDSFEDLFTNVTRGRIQGGWGSNGPRSGHWTVSDGTALKSGADDIEGNAPYTSCGGRDVGHAYGFSRERAITGPCLDKLAKANAQERERERQRLPTVAEVNDGATETPGANIAENTQKGKKIDGDGKFYVPKLDDSRGIRIKTKAGRSEVVRQPSLPPLPVIQFDPPRATQRTQPTKAESKKRPSPPPSAHSAQAPSVAPERSNVIRIVSKDGKELFMPLPGLFGVGSAVPPPTEKTAEQAYDQTSAGKEKAERDAKAANAAKEVRREREMAELKMSGALQPLESSQKSATSSRQSSRTASKAGWGEVPDKPASAALSKSTVTKARSAKDQPEEKLQSPRKHEKPQKQQNKTKPKPDPKDTRKPPSPGGQQPGGNKGSKDNRKPPSPGAQQPAENKRSPSQSKEQAKEISPRHSKGSDGASPVSRIEQWQGALPTAWRPPSVRTISEGSAAGANGAAQMQSPSQWRPPSVRTASIASAAAKGHTMQEVPSAGWQEIGQGTYQPPNQRSTSAGFQEVGQATYEPRWSNSDNGVFNPYFNPEAAAQAPSHSSRGSAAAGPNFKGTVALENVYQNLPIQSQLSVHSQNPHTASVTSHPSAHPGPHAWSPQGSQIYRRSASVGSHHAIKHETSQHGWSPQGSNVYHPPASVASHRSIKEEASLHSFHQQASVRSNNSAPHTSSAVSGEYVYPQRPKQASPQQSRRSSLRQNIQSPPQQPYEPSPLRQSWSAHQQGRSPRPQASSLRDDNPRDQQPGDGRPPTVFAGRGWISPHPLSVSGSDLEEGREQAIRIPAGHELAGSGSGSGAAGPATMTYNEWRAVQDERGTLSVRSERHTRNRGSAAGSPGNNTVRQEEQTERDQVVAARGEVTDEESFERWGQKGRSNWSRTTSSHERVDGPAGGRNAGGNWGLAGVESVKSDGRVQLRMPWDQ